MDQIRNSLKNYSKEQVEVLEASSIFENYFNLYNLLYLLDKETDALEKILESFINDGTLEYSQGFYRFKNIGIQTDVYSQICNDRKKWFHYRSGMYMLKNSEGESQEKDILNHFNHCLELLTQEKEICKIAALYLNQSKIAKNNLNHNLSHDYAQIGIWLLNESLNCNDENIVNSESTWEKFPELLSQLHFEAIESSFLNCNYDKMEEHIDELFVFSKLYLQESENYNFA